jgi:hypothetical protein
MDVVASELLSANAGIILIDMANKVKIAKINILFRFNFSAPVFAFIIEAPPLFLKPSFYSLYF